MKTKQIENYENYSVSDTGIIVSTAKVVPIILKPQKASQSKKKYLQVRLYNEESPLTKKGKKLGKLFYIHRLVWEAFNGKIPDGYEIDHIDNNPHNNNLDNLQLLSRRDNILKTYEGEDTFYLRQVRDEVIKDYIEIRNYDELANKWNVSPSTIFRTIKNKMNKNIKGKYHQVLFDEENTDLFATTNLRGKTQKQLIELWEKNYGVKYNSELG